MKRVLLLAAAAAFIPACDDDDNGGGSSVLFSDDFNRSAAGPDWHATSGASIDPSQGRPAPALAMSVGQANGEETAHMEASFAARPLTVTVDLSAVTEGEGSGGVEIVNAAHVPLASAERGADGGMTFTIGTDTQTVSSTAVPSGVLTVTFRADALGNATWSLGDTAVMNASGFPDDPVSVQLFTRSDAALPGAVFPTFLFDNVVVTSP